MNSYSDDDLCEMDYSDVSSFDHLLQINVDFLNNKIDETYYNVGPFEDDDNREALVKLHLDHRIYTTEMQYLENDNRSDSVCHSCLQFIVEPETARRLEPLLFSSDQLHTSVLSKTRAVDNFPKNSLTFNIMTWTDDKGKKHDDTNWWRNWTPDEFLETSYPNVDLVLQDCVVFFILAKDPSGPHILDILNQLL